MRQTMRCLVLALILISYNASAEQHRSQKAKAIFKYSHPCPSTGRNKGSCPNYIIDHIKPLACGGLDDANNMQWQTKAEAKAKDKWERNGC
jgi:hypothetical protein